MPTHRQTSRARGDRQSSNLAEPVEEGSEKCTENLFGIENRTVSEMRPSCRRFKKKREDPEDLLDANLWAEPRAERIE